MSGYFGSTQVMPVASQLAWQSPLAMAGANAAAPAPMMGMMPGAADLSFGGAQGLSYGNYGVPAGVDPGVAPTGGGFMAGMGDWAKQPGNLGSLAGGIAALGQAFLGFKALNQAKDEFGLQKTIANSNLNNSIKSYNTSLEDRIRGRTSDYAGKEGDVTSYLEKHRLTRSP